MFWKQYTKMGFFYPLICNNCENNGICMHGRTCFSVGGDRLVRRAICDEAMSEIQLKGL